MAKQTFSVGQTLTAAQMTSLQQTAMLGGAASAKTASYTLVAADAGSAISMSNASATTITVNTALFAAGDTVHITNLGAGVCTITAGTATVNSSASLSLAQYESGFLDFTSASAAIFVKGAGGSAGGMTLLATHTLSGSTSTISTISQSYKSLYGVIYGATSTGGPANWKIDPNGSTLITNTVTLEGSNASPTNYAYTATWYLGINYVKETGGDNCWSFTIDNYTSTTNHKAVKMSGTFITSSDAINATNNGGGIRTNSAITSLAFVTNAGSFNGGTVLLYGVN
jgi:hypothetical protein